MLNPEIKIITILPPDYQEWFEKFKEFLSAFLQTCPDSHKKNYVVQDWETSKSSFLKCIYVEQRYLNGCVTVAVLNEKIIALSACYKYKNNLYYMGSRSCVLPGYESLHLVSSYLIPTQQKFLNNIADYGFISFNTDKYSLRLLNSFKKRDKWTAAKVKRLSGLDYSPFVFIENRCFIINGCEQFVAYCTSSSLKLSDKDDFILQLSKDKL